MSHCMLALGTELHVAEYHWQQITVCFNDVSYVTAAVMSHHRHSHTSNQLMMILLLLLLPWYYNVITIHAVPLITSEFLLSFLPERDYITFGYLPSQFRPSSVVCLSVTFVHDRVARGSNGPAGRVGSENVQISDSVAGSV